MKIASFFIQDIVGYTGGKLETYHNNAAIQQVVYDTRSVFSSSVSVFIALKTPKRNGHDFIGEAYRKGVRTFMVDQDIQLPGDECNVIRVSNVLEALQAWATNYRKTIKCPVIAITGSNGKTTLKEWMNTLLATHFDIVRSPRSFNSQLGVPLSVLQIERNHKLAILEAGISKPGEMQKLANIIKPDITILTNVEQAHAVNFTDRQAHIREKLELAKTSSVLIFNSDDEKINEEVKTLSCQKIAWGFYSGSHRFSLVKGKLAYAYHEHTEEFDLNVNDLGSVQNICHAIVCSALLGIKPAHIRQQVSLIHPVEMRFELREGINNCKILNDSYSLDFHSFQLAVEYVGRNAGELKKTVIVSDFPEVSGQKDSFYRQAGKFLSDSKVDRVIAIGNDVSLISQTFSGKFQLFSSAHEFLEKASLASFKDELILIKGSRASQFEKIISFFDLRQHATYLKVDLAAIQHNLDYYQSLLPAGTKTMVMVKALAYGSGSREISHLLEFNRVDYLAVAYADEGVELRKSGVRLPIMVMNPDEAAFGLMSKYELQPELFNIALLHAFNKHVADEGLKNYPVHIKLDTGMHRLGFKSDDIDTLIQFFAGSENHLHVASVFSHLAGADDPQLDSFTLQQINDFEAWSSRLCEKLNYKVLRHILNSPGIERFTSHAFDMVRLGIGLHGVAATPATQEKLLPVHTLVSKISHIQTIGPDDTVGYSRKGKPGVATRIAVIPIGYADGYFRSFGNGTGKVLLRGQLAPVIGNVCMDMIMININAVPDAVVGDEVIVFGEKLPVATVASWVNTIPYEILTSVSTRVKRVYIDQV